MKKVTFKVEGAFVVDKMRGLMLDGEEDKALSGLCKSFRGMDGLIAERILEGEWTLKGFNNDITLDETADPEYKKELAEIRECTAKLKKTEWTIDDWKTVACGYAEGVDSVTQIETLQRLPPAKRYKDDQEPVKENETSKEIQHRIVKKLMRSNAGAAGAAIAQHIGLIEEGELVYPFKPHLVTIDDLTHSHWFISPKGDTYKVPYQKHNEWIADNYENLKRNRLMKFDEWKEPQPSYIEQGWVRISGGAGLMIVHVDSNSKIVKHALFDFILKFAANSFIVDISGARVFEMDIDYKRAQRLLNENINSWA